ncbi:phytanoyl-CoA dioxygenase family protein [Pseudoalteromonas byunsanensis]|uniref:Phytanoyl-CoA dioxygenase n=1 Tax=Pseudoalteromonas byunsanensis TaxID=327939 RepID=A0A1S1N8I7_9GAMM|nr:phytanoyl-CoA dioxygenase family protein [Pseudoalteromonas byunsanensis]OHU95742.1 hypothetical protein BIW53_07890 [Pseudoalteromonas byunsanensis]
MIESIAKQFNRNGYYLCEDIGIPKELFAAAKEGAYRLLEQNYTDNAKPWGYTGNKEEELTRIEQVHIADNALQRLITHPSVGRWAAELTGAKRVKVWGSQLYFKPSGSDNRGHVGFHRDSEHMPYFKSGAITAWLPLVDIGEDSGPLVVVKGSHLWPKSTQFSGAGEQDLEYQKRKIIEELDGQNWKEKAMLMQVGGVSFHHHDALHGSYSNTSAICRCAIAIGLITEQMEIDVLAPAFGYDLIINEPSFCPVIFNRE